jgi:hypothetical protein
MLRKNGKTEKARGKEGNGSGTVLEEEKYYA